MYDPHASVAVPASVCTVCEVCSVHHCTVRTLLTMKLLFMLSGVRTFHHAIVGLVDQALALSTMQLLGWWTKFWHFSPCSCWVGGPSVGTFHHAVVGLVDQVMALSIMQLLG